MSAVPFEVRMVPPGEILVDANVRAVVDLDRGFVESIRARGVVQPPIGWVDDEGLVHVVTGQQRVRACVQIEMPEMPVLIRPRHEAEADRIVEQLVENDRRKPLSEADRTAGMLALFELGVSADQIAKRTGAKRDKVRAVRKLSEESPRSVAELQEHREVTLDQLALIAEFEDYADLRADLYEVAEVDPGKFAHYVQSARDEVAKRAAHAVAVAELQAEGISYLPEEDLPDEFEWERLAALEEVEIPGMPVTEMVSPEQALAQGGLVARLYWGWIRDEGSRTWKPGWERTYMVETPALHGYLNPDYDDGEDEDYSDEGDDGHTVVDESPVVRKAREEREELERLAREEQAAWESACLVRREWMRDVLLQSRRKLPAGAGMVILDGWLRGGEVLPRFSTYTPAMSIAAGLLGVTGDAAEVPSPVSWVSAAEAVKFQVFRDLARGVGHERVLLAFALGAVESELERVRFEGCEVYLRLLQSWGYGLSDVEEQFCIEAEAKAAAAAAEGSAGGEG